MFVMVADASEAFCHLDHRGGCGPAKQHSIADKFNEFPALQRVSTREQSLPGRFAQGNSARTTSRPLQALKASYPGEWRPKSGTPVQGRGIAGSMVTCLSDPSSNKCG
jgi:hypothetical protein